MATQRVPLLLEQQLCFALYRASRAVIRAYAPLLEPLGLTYAQYLVMLVLWEHGCASIKELGERLALDWGTLTPLLKRMEKSGLLTRRRDRSDERILKIELTERGRQLRARARHIPSELACRAGFELGDARELGRLDRLRGQLDALAQRMEENSTPGYGAS